MLDRSRLTGLERVILREALIDHHATLTAAKSRTRSAEVKRDASWRLALVADLLAQIEPA